VPIALVEALAGWRVDGRPPPTLTRVHDSVFVLAWPSALERRSREVTQQPHVTLGVVWVGKGEQPAAFGLDCGAVGRCQRA
jgi:hypothetical protein